MTRRAATLMPLLAVLAVASACDKAGDAPPATPPAALAPVPETVEFADVTPQVGMQRNRSQQLLMDVTMDVDVDGQHVSTPFISKRVESKREEILAEHEGKVTKMLVTYGKVHDTTAQGEDTAVETSPVEGKSYIVALDGETVTVARKGTKKTPKAEREVVAKDYGGLGTRDRMCKRLIERPVAIGEEVELGASEFPAMEGGAGRVVLVLREVAAEDGREFARFDVEASLRGPMDDGEMRVDFGGMLVVDVRACSAAWFEVEGRIAMTATRAAKDGRPMTMKGEGRAKFSTLESLWQAPKDP